MDPMGKEVAIDVGGGLGEYFVERAKKEPSKQFVILEPRRLRIARKPQNLHIVQWRSDEESALPFKASSVDEANINFLYGISKWGITEDSYGPQPYQAKKYEKILNDLKSVLKQGGKLHIVEAKFRQGIIVAILKKLGYRLEGEPEFLQDKERTFWSKEHADTSSSLEPGPELYPVLIKASL